MTDSKNTNKNHIEMQEQGEGSRGRSLLVSFAVLVVLLFLSYSFAAFYLKVFQPKERTEPVQPFEGYDRQLMQDALSPEHVKAEQKKILSFGDRFAGMDSFYDVGEYIRQAYEDAGLEMIEHDNITAIPKTTRREISLSDGGPMGGVEIYPFMPNHLQPMVTPEGGLTGELVLINRDTLKEHSSFTGVIGVVDVREENLSPSHGYNWLEYARLGLSAVILAHPDSFEEIPWTKVGDRFSGMVGSDPVNFVRLCATPEIYDYLGQQVTLNVKTEWAKVPNKTYIGIMRAPGSAAKAMVIPTNYDAISYLPDMAPGALSAVSPATQLALLQGMTAYKDSLRRDVIFVAYGSEVMAADGINNILSVIDYNIAKSQDNPLVEALGLGDTGAGDAMSDKEQARLQAKQKARMTPLVKRNEENKAKLEKVQLVLSYLEQADFLADWEATREIVKEMDDDTREFLNDQVRYLLNTIMFDYSEPMLQAKVAMERKEMEQRGSIVFDPDDRTVKEYLAVKEDYDAALSAAGYSLLNLMESKMDFMEKEDLRDLVSKRFAELEAYHLREEKVFEQGKALVNLFNPYQEIIFVKPYLLPAFDEASGKETFSFHPGNMSTDTQPPTMMSLIRTTQQRLGMRKDIKVPELVRNHSGTVSDQNCEGAPFLIEGMISEFGYPTFSFVNFGRHESYARYALPIDQPFMHDIESLEKSLKLLAEVTLSLAHGVGKFKPSGTRYWLPKTVGGRVLVSNVGQSVVPNYPLKDALIGGRGVRLFGMFSFPGYYQHLLKYTDVYGEFWLPNNASDFVVWWKFYRDGGYSPVCAAYGEDGLIAYMKDEGEEGQRLYKSVKLSSDKKTWKNITIVTFRASPVSVLDVTNPQTMTLYSDVELMSQKRLTPFTKKCVFTDGRMYTTFIEPHERFYVTLKAGSPENELAQVIRAFALGVPMDYEGDKNAEIGGPGYLAYDHTILQNVAFEVAKSMAYLNGKRLDLQNRYNMADERTNVYHEKSRELAQEAMKKDITLRERILTARESVTYSTLNHPVIRNSIAEAVWGIIWYLGLLVPFCFFFEKLVFGFPDIRHQITANAVIFISVFALLWYLHPAFEMVRSSLMILLGFVIIMISGGIMFLFFGKFQENLEGLRKSQGKVSAAEVNTMGAIGSAFMLGLNNMHRRKVRTGLTCITLVLMTFVMICFSSVQSNLVDETIALGRAPYQGILVKEENFREIKSLNAIRNEYGEDFAICPRKMVFGSQDWQERRSTNPELEVEFDSGERVRSYEFDSIIQFTHNEPLQEQIEFVTEKKWFTEDQEMDTAIMPVFLPDRMAGEIGVTEAMVDSGQEVEVRINGRRCVVQGIFSSESYENLRDIDGFDVLPYDIEAMSSVVIDEKTGEVRVTEEDPRVPATRIVLAPYRDDMRISANNTRQSDSGTMAVPVSVVISLENVPYRQAKELVNSYLERKAEAVFYGLGGVAYSGKRTRESSLAGLVELIIPLFIAALTVLNTMRGSVYERRDEIFVYNAVGIAPRYVFFMFFAEAIVYAVVGSVLGYILSQGVGVILTSINLTGGLNMSFTSLATIFASMAIAMAVFISTLFPAMSAMEIASPAEESGWDLPEPDGDELRFSLPFTFNHRDHIAILAFFGRYLRDHGEGSAGRFFAGTPEMGVAEELDPLANDSYIPELDCTVWLKPFDLAVSQQMQLVMPTDEETHEYIAQIHLTRLSGTRESWMRLNKGFIRLIRRHFLHWRAVSDEERQEMFEEAREMILRIYSIEMVTNA